MKAKKQPEFIVEIRPGVEWVAAELKAEILAMLEQRFGIGSAKVKRLNAAAVQKLARDWS